MHFLKWTSAVGLLASLVAGQEDVSTASGSSPSSSITSTSSSTATTSIQTTSSPSSTSSTSIIAGTSLTTTISTSSTSVVASSSSTTTSSSVSPTVPSTATSVVVAADGSAAFTGIGAAILYAQQKAIPTVYVQAGTYNEAILVSGTSAVTIIGASSSSNDYNRNQVIVTTSGIPMTINTNDVTKTVWRNINFVSTSTAAAAWAVSLRGTKNAFYNCQMITAGNQAVYSTYGITLIANSYIEAASQTVAGFLGMYIYGSTVTATAASNGIVLYNKGIATTNSQVVFDSCTLTQKTGYTNKRVYLAAPNGNYAQAVFRNTYMSDMIISAGVYPYAATTVNNYYGEYNTSGAGSYASNSATRGIQDNLMTSSQLSSWSIDRVFANSFPPYATSDLSWIDPSVLAAIQAADANSITTSVSTGSSSSSQTPPSSSVTIASVGSSSSAVVQTSTTSSVASTSTDSSSSSIVPTSTSSSSTTASMGSTSGTSASSSAPSGSSSTSVLVTPTSSTVSASATSNCTSYTLPSSIPSTASVKVVGPIGSCASYTSVAAAISDLPNDSSTWYVYILAGTYDGNVTLSRRGATVFRGQSSSPLDQSSNLVTITNARALVTGSGSSEGTSTFLTTQYNAKHLAFYNINFVNSYPQTNNYIAIAFDAKAQQVGFYSCGFKSTDGTFLANYGSFYLAGCRIEGSQDFFWGYGAAYVYNSLIVSNAAGYSIAAQSYQEQYGSSQFVFDTCAIVPSSSSIGSSSTFLGRDYSASARVAYVNSFIDGHIKPVGWSVGSTGTNVTFVEANNIGPGASTSSRSSKVSILSDGSQYSAANVLGDISWVDAAAIPAFSGFPSPIFPGTAALTTSVTSSTSSIISSVSSLTSSTALGSTNATATATTSSSVSSTSSAACPTDTLVVNQTPENSCQYSTISAAAAALANDGLEKTILVYPGRYNEQISVNRTGKVTLRGTTSYVNDFTQNQVIVYNAYGVSTSANQDELTPVLYSKKSNLAVYNIDFHNTFEQAASHAALAADFYGSNMAFYGCSFIGYQDTLLLNQGVQVLSNCYIEGSVDFIWGFSTAYMHGCYIAANTPGASIVAMSRRSASTAGGYVIDSSLITYTSTYGSSMGQTYLGRPYSSYSRVVYMNSYLDSNINPAGWSIWQTSNPQTDNVLFGEYNNTGPSSSTANRASFSTQLDATAVQAYTLQNWIGDTSWLDMATYNLPPSYSWSDTSATKPTSPASNTTAISSTSSATASATATATASATCGHPSSGTDVPVGAVVVDASNSTSGSYPSLTSALAALPKDSSCQVIFMMPGTYNEQAAVNRPGQTQIIGYANGSPGQGYSNNQVTISYSRGLSVSPLPTGHSDSETAVITTTSSNIAFYNVNFVNTANSDGSTPSFVTLAGSVYGSHIGFYGCSLIGWQDTLLTGSTNGYQYYESCYIEGAIDFIWGYSAAYFKGCTIAAKRKSSAITAHSRASSSAVGAYVFDECLVTAPPAYSSAIQASVFLGRPYSSYAKVVYKNSYLDSIIAPSGWKTWSTSDPRTDHITFAEYNNIGPGNWENNAAARVAWGNCTLLTSDTYTLSSIMDSTSWIDMTYWDSISIPTGVSSTVPPPPTTTPQTPPTVVANATSPRATSPGDTDYIVSKTPITGKTTYNTISDAMSAINSVSRSTTVTIFIYPGVYQEQLTFNRSGTTIFRGYTESPDDNAQNQVIVQNSHGVDTQTDQSNSDSATLYSRAKYIQLYNINLNNLFGTEDDYASLGFAIGNNGYASFYGCQITGNQDTFDLNSGTNVFTYNTLIEGSIDFIWGSGSAYFLNSTIVPNADGGCITADKRSTNGSIGGLVFDQCTIAAAAGVSPGSIYLGRPYSQYARVAWINSYLDSSVAPAGWSVWSRSSPQTNGVLFGEYHNYGPGSSTASRASFSEQLTDADVAQFQLANFFSTQGTSWINMTYVHTAPFTAGSSPVATYTSSSSVATVTPTSTSEITTVLPESTITITRSTTAKVTAYTTLSADPVTRFTTVSVALGSSSTVTPAPVIITRYRTTTSTEGSTSTLTPDEVTVTRYTTILTSVGSTVTVTPDLSTVLRYSTIRTTVGSSQTIVPDPVTTTRYATSTTTSFYTSTAAASTVTQTQVATVYGTSTYSPSPRLVTVTTSSYLTSTRVQTARPITFTRTISTLTIPGSVTTSTPRSTTVYVTSTSTATRTSSVTTTLSCTPLAKRDSIPVDRFHVRALVSHERRAVVPNPSTATYTYTSTLTSTVKTVSSVIPGQTVTATTTATSLVTGVTTLRAVTTTTTSTIALISSITDVSVPRASSTTSTSTVLQTSTISGLTTLRGSTTTSTAVVTQTSSIGGVTTLRASTTTVTSPVVVTRTSSVRTTAPVATVVVSATRTSNSVVTLPQSTSTVTVIRTGSTTVTSYAPTSTVEIDRTITSTGARTTVTAPQVTITRTTTHKTTTTAYSTVTRYARGATTCAA